MRTDEYQQPSCPTCGQPLERLGDDAPRPSDASPHAVDVYVCPAGCKGQTGEGTFEFAECPLCGSHDTSQSANLDGAEELQCHTCGAIVAVQLHPFESVRRPS
jgi:transcription elongation factor Elf1